MNKILESQVECSKTKNTEIDEILKSTKLNKDKNKSFVRRVNTESNVNIDRDLSYSESPSKNKTLKGKDSLITSNILNSNHLDTPKQKNYNVEIGNF